MRRLVDTLVEYVILLSVLIAALIVTYLEKLIWYLVAGIIFWCVWNGWSFEVGSPDSPDYVRFYQLPLRRFFQ